MLPDHVGEGSLRVNQAVKRKFGAVEQIEPQTLSAAAPVDKSFVVGVGEPAAEKCVFERLDAFRADAFRRFDVAFADLAVFPDVVIRRGVELRRRARPFVFAQRENRPAISVDDEHQRRMVGVTSTLANLVGRFEPDAACARRYPPREHVRREVDHSLVHETAIAGFARGGLSDLGQLVKRDRHAG
jgi:hypothetical protein